MSCSGVDMETLHLPRLGLAIAAKMDSSVAALNHPMKQLIQILIVVLNAAQQNPIVVGQCEKGSRHPAGWDRHPQLASPIVVENLDAFKAEILQKLVGNAL